jgi:arylamine N-acetyltransferase
MTKYQAWKLYGRYVLRRIGKRARSLLARVFPGIAPAARRPRAKRGA